MKCVHCSQPENGVIDNELCKQAVWLGLSKKYTNTLESLKKQYDLVINGREPLAR
jgi:hypothetical protein